MPESQNVPEEAPEPQAGGSSVSPQPPAAPDGKRRFGKRRSGTEGAGTEGAGTEGTAKSEAKKTNWLVEIGTIVVIAIVLSFLLQNFVGRQWYVPSESMEPTLVGCAGCTGDRIVTEKLSYYFGDPKPGDVVVFKGPTSSWDNPTAPDVRSSNTVIRGIQEALALVGLQPPNENDLVKRVIATGGETIGCTLETGLTVDGAKLNEPYLAASAKAALPTNPCLGAPFGPITVPDGNVFVMGDNRLNSGDSRYHIGDRLQGTVPESDIRGKVQLIIYPFSRMQTVDSVNPQQ